MSRYVNQQYLTTNTRWEGMDVYEGEVDRLEYVWDERTDQPVLLSDVVEHMRQNAPRQLPRSPYNPGRGRPVPNAIEVPNPSARHGGSGRQVASPPQARPSRQYTPPQPVKEQEMSPPPAPSPVQKVSYINPAWLNRKPQRPVASFTGLTLGVEPDSLTGEAILRSSMLTNGLTDNPHLLVCRFPIDAPIDIVGCQDPDQLAGKLRLILGDESRSIITHIKTGWLDAWLTDWVNSVMMVLENGIQQIECFSTDWAELRGYLATPRTRETASEVKLYNALVELLRASVVTAETEPEEGGEPVKHTRIETTIGFIPDIDRFVELQKAKESREPLTENNYLTGVSRAVLVAANGGQAGILTADGVLAFIIQFEDKIYLV